MVINNSSLLLIIQDILSFLGQILPPKPTRLFRPYRFSSVDLPKTTIISDDVGRPGPGMMLLQPIEALGANQEANTSFLGTYFDILSFNVNNVVAAHDSIRRRRILHAIFSSGAHVVLLQETNPQWEELLRKKELYPYNYFHHPGRDERAAGGIAILSQYPLENVIVLDFTKDVPMSVFPALVCSVKLPIRYQQGESLMTSYDLSINIAVVHLRPPVELDGSAWLETARVTGPIRLREVQELMNRTAKIAKEDEVGGGRLHIIAGDFNEGDDSEAITYLAKLGFTNALQVFVPRCKETHTWPFMRNLLVLRKRLDHILWRDGPLHASVTNRSDDKIEFKLVLQCIGCGVVTGYETNASDHQPILSRFALVKG